MANVEGLDEFLGAPVRLAVQALDTPLLLARRLGQREKAGEPVESVLPFGQGMVVVTDQEVAAVRLKSGWRTYWPKETKARAPLTDFVGGELDPEAPGGVAHVLLYRADGPPWSFAVARDYAGIGAAIVGAVTPAHTAGAGVSEMSGASEVSDVRTIADLLRDLEGLDDAWMVALPDELSHFVPSGEATVYDPGDAAAQARFADRPQADVHNLTRLMGWVDHFAPGHGAAGHLAALRFWVWAGEERAGRIDYLGYETSVGNTDLELAVAILRAADHHLTDDDVVRARAAIAAYKP